MLLRFNRLEPGTLADPHLSDYTHSGESLFH